MMMGNMMMLIMTVTGFGDHGEDNADRTIHLGSQGAGQAGPHSTEDRTRRRQLVDTGETSHAAHLHNGQLARRVAKDEDGLLLVGQVGAGEGGEEGGGGPGEGVLVLSSAGSTCFGKHRDQTSIMCSFKPAWVGEGEAVDTSNSRHKDNNLTPGLMDGHPAQEGSVKEAHPDSRAKQVVVEGHLVEVEGVVGGAPIQSSVGQGGAGAIVLVSKAASSVR